MSVVAEHDDGLPIGSVIEERYRIDGVLGSGGMGRVYRGEHLGIGRPVAIKVLHASMGANKEAVARFQREALAAGRLDHPNIVAVSDFGVMSDDAAYLVMEALDGEPLGTRLERGRLPWREALAVIRGALAGLAHAHEKGVVHRDIKPDNVFLVTRDAELVVKVLDFGIAKLFAGAEDDPATTRQGMTIGTPAYLSPEQAVGGEITPATDLYSATVVLFEMLAGRPPFQGGDALAMLGAHAAAPPPTLREAAPDIEVPDALEALVARGLAKRAADRVPSALDYLAAIDAITGEAVRAARISRPIAAMSPRDTEVDTPAVVELGHAETQSLTPLPAVAQIVTLHQAIREPIPRRWWLIGGAILGGALLIAIVLSLVGGGSPSSSSSSPSPSPSPKKLSR